MPRFEGPRAPARRARSCGDGIAVACGDNERDKCDFLALVVDLSRTQLLLGRAVASFWGAASRR